MSARQRGVVPIRARAEAPIEASPNLIAYRLHAAPVLPLVPASRARQWMEETPRRFAQRCLPLLIANQAGWFLLNTHDLRVRWNGEEDTEGLTLQYLSGEPPYPAVSHFGSGILTWHVPYLFRTPPGWNLLARGPSNWPKEGAFALEGIVETDWAVATFTMNWKITRIRRPVTFSAGEPICMIVPQRRNELEGFVPEIRDIDDDEALAGAYRRWTAARSRFLTELREPGSAAEREEWQRHYFRGTAPDGTNAPIHQTKLALREFVDPDGISFVD
jgi:antitoxin (DNA-binding transcriptional repressor) of toxin-antitoxin stability system